VVTKAHVGFLSGLLASRFRLSVGTPRSLLTDRRSVRTVSGTSGPARLEAGGSASKTAESCIDGGMEYAPVLTAGGCVEIVVLTLIPPD